jgi:hypothetical protein
VNHFADAVLFGALQRVLRAADIGAHDLLAAALNRQRRRGVHRGINAFRRALDNSLIGHIAFDNFDAAFLLRVQQLRLGERQTSSRRTSQPSR